MAPWKKSYQSWEVALWCPFALPFSLYNGCVHKQLYFWDSWSPQFNFPPKNNVESCWLQLPACSAHTRCCACLEPLQRPAKWAHGLASSCQRQAPLESFGVLLLWEWRGCGSLSPETPHTCESPGVGASCGTGNSSASGDAGSWHASRRKQVRKKEAEKDDREIIPQEEVAA